MDNASHPRFTTIKKAIAASYPQFEERVTKAWGEVLAELDQVTKTIIAHGPTYIPEVKFSEIAQLDLKKVEEIRTKGCVVVRDMIDDDEALKWKESLEDIIKAHPDVEGFPPTDRQFYELYWTKAQLAARSHPNMLAACTWLNNFYHSKSGQNIGGVDLSIPLTYADRIRIRRPGQRMTSLPPHIDGATLERWEEPNTRECFTDILTGNWRLHDPYDLDGRLEALTSLYNRPNQCSVFRTFQGWLSMGNTGPNEGTLRVFPNVHSTNAYIILRPFFRPLVPSDSPDIYNPKNWEFDIDTPEFPGIVDRDGGFYQMPSAKWHPNLRLDQTMIPMPRVKPGDAVFWHCDVIHCVEEEHKGTTDSAVMFIPAVPSTPKNEAYVEKQYKRFLEGLRPADFPQGKSELSFTGIGRPEDIVSAAGRRAMAMAA